MFVKRIMSNRKESLINVCISSVFQQIRDLLSEVSIVTFGYLIIKTISVTADI